MFQCRAVLLVLEVAKRSVVGEIGLVPKGMHGVRVFLPGVVVVYAATMLGGSFVPNPGVQTRQSTTTCCEFTVLQAEKMPR